MAPIRSFPIVQAERSSVLDIQRRVLASPLGQIISQLRASLPREEARLPSVVHWLARDEDLRPGSGVLARVGDKLLNLVVGGPVLRKDANLHPDSGRFSVLRDLAVEGLPGGRVGVGPGLDDGAAGAVGPPHAGAANGDVALGDVLGHGAADEAHRAVGLGFDAWEENQGWHDAEDDVGETKLHGRGGWNFGDGSQ